ncbi:MAG: hypothetical protein AB7L09_03060 [Nitrospira sp.]
MPLPDLTGVFGHNHDQWQRFFARQRPPKLNYERSREPDGWPLTRPASKDEWSHVLRVMIVRRIPETVPIHRGKLIGYVHADLEAASNAGRLYVDSFFVAMRSVHAELSRLVHHYNVVKTAPNMSDPDMPWPDEAVYRTERTDLWLSRVPKLVQVVVDYLPTTSALDLLVQALYDAPDESPSPPTPHSSES